MALGADECEVRGLLSEVGTKLHTSSLPAAGLWMSSPIMSLTQTSLHLRQHCHAKTSSEELKLALLCLSYITHRTVTGICGLLSTASDVGGRQAPAGFSDLGQSEQSTRLKGDNPLWTSARSKFNEEVIFGEEGESPPGHIILIIKTCQEAGQLL